MNTIIVSLAFFAALYLTVGFYWLILFWEPLVEAIEDSLELFEEAAKIVFLWPFTINK